MSFDRQAALDAGYSEEEINAYLQGEAKRKKAEPTTAGDEPPPPGAPIEPVGMSGTEMATTAAMAVPAAASAALPYAGAAVGAYGAYKAAQVANKFLKSAPPAAAPYGSPSAPIGSPVGSPVAPAAAPAAAPATAARPVAPSMMQRGGDLAKSIQQIAASRVLPAAQGLVRGAVAPSMALYSGSTGPAVPSVGRMRGMEINPLTGRGWTPEQIAQYERNFQAFDAQLPPPQMPR